MNRRNFFARTLAAVAACFVAPKAAEAASSVGPTTKRDIDGYYAGPFFKIGDHVMLKSGSPPMLVTGFSPRGSAWCEWTCGERHVSDGLPYYHEHAFPAACLCLYTGKV